MRRSEVRKEILRGGVTDAVHGGGIEVAGARSAGGVGAGQTVGVAGLTGSASGLIEVGAVRAVDTDH